MTTKNQALTLRLPPELHEQLRTLSFLTRRSINDLASSALSRWMETSGHDLMVEAATRHGQERHRVALDKLKDL
jgi:predicted DNA-binding protein